MTHADNRCTHASEALNQCCDIVSVDREQLKRLVDTEEPELYAALLNRAPHIFAAQPVFIPREHLDAMTAVIRAVQECITIDEVREAVLRDRPAIARIDYGPSGVFFGYDFHLGRAGPQLIEINTNAGGGLLNSALAKAQRTCCAEADDVVMFPQDAFALEQTFVEMFRREWQAQRPDVALRRVAIVDEDPTTQYLYPEFRLAQRMFERAGWEAAILAPEQLTLDAGRLRDDKGPIDLVYNRTCDFYLERLATLREAYTSSAAVITPHPRAYALFGDKRSLTLLSDPSRLAAWGVGEATIDVLRRGVPRTTLVTTVNRDELWGRRKQLFFKPTTGYGSRAAYRGSKVTTKVWSTIGVAESEHEYVAQELVTPSEQTITVDGQAVPLKLDVRAFVYDGRVQLFVARLYQGQTTNLRTPGGGFASVYTDRVRGEQGCGCTVAASDSAGGCAGR